MACSNGDISTGFRIGKDVVTIYARQYGRVWVTTNVSLNNGAYLPVTNGIVEVNCSGVLIDVIFGISSTFKLTLTVKFKNDMNTYTGDWEPSPNEQHFMEVYPSHNIMIGDECPAYAHFIANMPVIHEVIV